MIKTNNGKMLELEKPTFGGIKSCLKNMIPKTYSQIQILAREVEISETSFILDELILL